MASYHIACPACQQSFSLDESQLSAYVGRQVPCSKCGAVFTVVSDASGVRAVAPAGIPVAATLPYQAGLAPAPANGMAVTGLVCGILGLFTCGLLAIPGLICSILGLKKANERQGSGKGLAIAGICCSGAAILFIPLLISILLPSLAKARETANRARCSNNLRQIALAEIMYANENKQAFAPDLPTLMTTQSLDKSVFLCPSADPTLEKNIGGVPCVYIYVGQGLTGSSPSDAVIAYEPLEAHGGNGMNVAYADGHVSFESKATASKIISELKKGHNPPQLP